MINNSKVNLTVSKIILCLNRLWKKKISIIHKISLQTTNYYSILFFVSIPWCLAQSNKNQFSFSLGQLCLSSKFNFVKKYFFQYYNTIFFNYYSIQLKKQQELYRHNFTFHWLKKCKNVITNYAKCDKCTTNIFKQITFCDKNMKKNTPIIFRFGPVGQISTTV